MSEHHLCHFGIRLIGNQPSSIVYHILSTKRIDSHKCSHEGEVHANERDLITGKMGAQQEWLRVETELCRKLMKDWCADLFVCLESVDLADSNPTHCDWGSDQHLGLKGSNQARKPDSTPDLQKQDTQPTDANVVGSPNNTGANYPTESAIRGKEHRKALKEQGKFQKRKPRVVEDHYDDLGDDLSGLGDDIAYLKADYLPEVQAPDSEESTDEEFTGDLATQFFFGDPTARPISTDTVRMSSMTEACTFLNNLEKGLDLCELCGGDEARTSQVAIRRRLQAGKNFDLVVDADLGDPRTQAEVINYIQTNNVMIVVMAPSYARTSPLPAITWQPGWVGCGGGGGGSGGEINGGGGDS